MPLAIWWLLGGFHGLFPGGGGGEALNPLKLFIFANLHFSGEGNPYTWSDTQKGLDLKKKKLHTTVVDWKVLLVKLPASRPTCPKLVVRSFIVNEYFWKPSRSSGPKLQVEQSAQNGWLSSPVFAPLVVGWAVLFNHSSLYCSLSTLKPQMVLIANPSSEQSSNTGSGKLKFSAFSHLGSTFTLRTPWGLFWKSCGQVLAEFPPTRTVCSFIGFSGRMENLYQRTNAPLSVTRKPGEMGLIWSGIRYW